MPDNNGGQPQGDDTEFESHSIAIPAHELAERILNPEVRPFDARLTPGSDPVTVRPGYSYGESALEDEREANVEIIVVHEKIDLRKAEDALRNKALEDERRADEAATLRDQAEARREQAQEHLKAWMRETGKTSAEFIDRAI